MGCQKLHINTFYPTLKVVKGDLYGQLESGVGSYRYGYNGMEKDGEASGSGNSYTTEFRQYDPRLGRWKSLDPLMMEFPDMSPFCAFDNNPVLYIDLNGLESTGGDKGSRKHKIDGIFNLKLGKLTIEFRLGRYGGKFKGFGKLKITPYWNGTKIKLRLKYKYKIHVNLKMYEFKLYKHKWNMIEVGTQELNNGEFVYYNEFTYGRLKFYFDPFGMPWHTTSFGSHDGNGNRVFIKYGHKFRIWKPVRTLFWAPKTNSKFGMRIGTENYDGPLTITVKAPILLKNDKVDYIGYSIMRKEKDKKLFSIKIPFLSIQITKTER
jgi:RHS repeat-associated protein